MPQHNQIVAVGTHYMHKQPHFTGLEEIQWDVNNINQISFTSGQLLKFTYRHAPVNATLESVFMDYRVVNNGAVDADVLPIWAGGVREMRVYVNNKRVLDWTREEQCKTSWNTQFLTSHSTDRARDNAYHVATGELATLNGANDFNPVTVAAGGGTHQFHLNFQDVWDGFSAAMPLNRVGLIEVEINLSSRGDHVCNPQAAVGDLRIEDLTVYSRHKMFGPAPPPSMLGHFTIHHKDYDLFTLAPAQHPFANPNREFDINISTEFPKRELITRIILFARDPSDAQAYRRVNSAWVDSMELLRGGLTMYGTEHHYDTPRKIFKEVSHWMNRHHSLASPTHPGDANHGGSFYTNFIDCTTVRGSMNHQAGQDVKHVEVNGIDNHSNLVLRIRNAAGVVSATSNLVCLVEYMRFDKLLGNGAVVKVVEANP